MDTESKRSRCRWVNNTTVYSKNRLGGCGLVHLAKARGNSGTMLFC